MTVGNLPPALPSRPVEPNWPMRVLRMPVLASIINDRKLALGMSAVAGIQVLAALFHFRTFSCPMLVSTGVPCPGCGLSRGCGAFITGDWHTWLNYHPFAPAFLIAAALILVSIFLPKSARTKLAVQIARIERATGVVPLTIFCLIFYWMLRLGYASTAYIALMRGE